MKPSYFVIELSARWLTVLLAALALSLIMAFAFGYGAAWSVLSKHPSGVIELPPVILPSPTVVPASPTAVSQTTASPVATATVRPVAVQPTPAATATPTATATPVSVMPSPTPIPPARFPSDKAFWVQVLASSQRGALRKTEKQLTELGFGTANQRVDITRVAGGSNLYKLRIGPFPDRASADRVSQRMRTAGFSDAWVVSP